MRKLYTSIISILFVTSGFATMHVSYPHDQIYSGPLYYDLDLDGDNDFSFDYNGGSYSYDVISSKNTSNFAADAGNNPKGYTAGAGMGTYHWQTGTGHLKTGSSVGQFVSGDKYLMVQFQNTSGTTFYAWFFITNDGTEVSSYGWEDVANQTVTPGQTSGIEDLTGTVVSSTISNGFVSFTDCGNFDKAVVYTIEGKQLANIEKPVAMQNYAVGTRTGLLVIAFYRREQMLASAKYVAK